MAKDGYISLHRQIQDHWLWKKSKPFSKGQAWIDMLFRAGWKDDKALMGNQLKVVPRGTFYASERQLAKAWGWPRSTVTRFKQLLSSDGMIETKNDPKSGQITILNYDKFQALRTRPEPDLNQTRTTPEPDDHHFSKEINDLDTRNKGNKVNKYNNNTYTSDFLKFYECYPKKVGKRYAFQCWRKSNGRRPALDVILDKLERQKRSRKWQEGFIPNPSTYINQDRWEDEIGDEKTDRNYAKELFGELTEEGNNGLPH